MYVIVKCPNKECLYQWNYRGLSKFYTSCPRCGWRVNVKKQKIDLGKGLRNFAGI